MTDGTYDSLDERPLDTKFDAWFVHPKLALALLDPQVADDLMARLPSAASPMARSYQTLAFERALNEVLKTLDVAALAVADTEGALASGMLVWVDQRVYYSGTRQAIRETEAGRHGRGTFHAPLATNASVTIRGSFNAEHLTSGSSAEQMSGARRHFILGYVESLSAEEVHLRPVLIAKRWGPGRVEKGRGFVESNPHHVFVQQIDQFAEVDFSTRLERTELTALREVSEQQVKEWFADIIGEPEIPKDWGGEEYDLWTTRMSIAGAPVRAAIAFKGPAKFHPMTIADLGKNGDQITRLAKTTADLLVVQHCHAITSQVDHMLNAYAMDPHNPRRYAMIDGYQTLRILRHFGHLS